MYLSPSWACDTNESLKRICTQISLRPPQRLWCRLARSAEEWTPRLSETVKILVRGRKVLEICGDYRK
jgi:hypothetical protein